MLPAPDSFTYRLVPLPPAALTYRLPGVAVTLPFSFDKPYATRYVRGIQNSIACMETNLMIEWNEKESRYDFGTDEMEGSLVGSGFYHGVRSLRDKRSQLGIPRPDLFLLNFYRAFVTGKQLGYLRDLEHEHRAEGNRLEILMKPSDWHQAELRTTYEIVAPSIIDLHIQLKSHADYERYHIFLSSYFSRDYHPYVYASRGVPYKGGREPGILHLAESDFVRGYYLAFPRDRSSAARWCDGRTDSDTLIGPSYAEPLAFMFNRHAETACAIMGSREDCDLITATYQPAEVWDGVSAHNAIYFALGGRDLAAGEEWSITVRLQLFWIRHNFGSVLEGYESFAG